MIRGIIFVIAGASVSVPAMKPAAAQQPTGGAWRFVVSGVPGIARRGNAGDCGNGRRKIRPAFYWHLRRLRAHLLLSMKTSNTSPNISRNRYRLRITKALRGPTSSTARLRFRIDSFLLGIGNHETIPPLKTREDFLLQFADWLAHACVARASLEGQPAGLRPGKLIFIGSTARWRSTTLTALAPSNLTPPKWAGSSGRWQATWPIRP